MKRFFHQKKMRSLVEQRFDTMMGLIKDLPRAEYNRLKDAMDLGYQSYQKIKNVQTDEEIIDKKITKENSDIALIEATMDNGGKK